MNENGFFKFEEWAKYADEDIMTAELLLRENGTPNQICFHAQQAAEKYLKGFLSFHKKKFEKVHQLSYLLQLCAGINSAFEGLREDIFYLTRFYIETRYPGDFPEFSHQDAKKAYEAALRVKEFVLMKVKT